MIKISAYITLMKQKAAAGVPYVRGGGAICPSCGAKKLRVVTTRKWKNGKRKRFHECRNSICVLSVLKINVKSFEQKKVLKSIIN